jgi:1-acyl-sn-glycerol-3-phosphate acyltransferase
VTDRLVVAAPRPPAARGLPELGLRTLRPWARRYLERRWDVQQRGVHKVPEAGPVIFASNHLGWLDGPLLIICTPRPAHALVKSEAFVGRTGRLLRFAGQIPLDRFRRDVGALRTAADALAAGQSVVVYPEGLRGAGDVAHTKDGVAWLALVSGAPVVPVALFGTRAPGADAESRPARGARVDIVYGEPLRIDPVPWPRTRAHVADVGRRITEHLRRHVEWAAATGHLELPGPLPRGSTDA